RPAGGDGARARGRVAPPARPAGQLTGPSELSGDPMALAPGKRIGKYELRRKLGEGGFGFVFVANDTSLDREVALKFLRAEHTANVEILRRFLQEARLAAKIVHPGIVTVFECGQIAGTGSVV